MDIKDIKFGYIPSEKSHKDLLYGQVININADPLPTTYIPEKKLPIETQTIGDCVGRSSRDYTWLQLHETNPNIDFEGDFVYSESKKIDGSPNDEGTQPKCAMQILQTLGICQKGLYPTLATNDNRPEPSQQALDDAKKFAAKTYVKVQTLDEIKHSVLTTKGCMIAVLVLDNFVHCESGGFIPLPQGSWLGGHAVVVDGFSDDMEHVYADGKKLKGFLRFANHWGTAWGDQGYGYLPYDFLTYTNVDVPIHYFSEAWSMVDLPEVQPQPNNPVPTPSPVTPSPTPVPPHSQPKQQHKEQIDMWLDKKEFNINGFKHTFDVAPRLDKDTNRTVVELRGLCDITGWNIEWNENDPNHVILYRD